MLQNFQNFAKNQIDNLVDFEKCCKTRIWLQRSAPIQPKTSEHLPKVCQTLATTLRGSPGPAERHGPGGAGRGGRGRGRGGRAPEGGPRRPEAGEVHKCLILQFFSSKFCKFLAGSFSAVSKRNFARKYAFDSIFQALQDLHLFAPLQSQNFLQKIGLKIQQFSWRLNHSAKCLQMLQILQYLSNFKK